MEYLVFDFLVEAVEEALIGEQSGDFGAVGFVVVEGADFHLVVIDLGKGRGYEFEDVVVESFGGGAVVVDGLGGGGGEALEGGHRMNYSC